MGCGFIGSNKTIYFINNPAFLQIRKIPGDYDG